MLLGIIILFMLGLSILLGVLEHYRDVNKIRSCAKHYRSFPVKRILSIAILLLALFLYLGILSKTVSLLFATIAVLLVFLLTVTLAVLEYRELVNYRLINKYKKVTGVLGGIFTLFASVGISILVDSEISGLTGLASAEFPNAQRLNFLLFGALFLSIAALTILTIAYVFQAAFVLLNMLRSAPYVNGVYGSISVILGRKRIQRSNEISLMAIFIGIMISAVSLNLALQHMLSKGWLRDRIRDYLIFSSYQEAPKYCSNLNSETTKVAFLRGRQLSIASYQNDGTILFHPGLCIREASLEKDNS